MWVVGEKEMRWVGGRERNLHTAASYETVRHILHFDTVVLVMKRAWANTAVHPGNKGGTASYRICRESV